jgi:hypothetical protein
MRTKAYAISQRICKRVEKMTAWLKTIGAMARTRFVGRCGRCRGGGRPRRGLAEVSMVSRALH